MNFTRLFALFVVAGLPVFGQSPGLFDSPQANSPQASSPQAETRLARWRHSPIRIREHRFDGSVTSENWSGYAVAGAIDSVTSVSASWVVPAAICGGSEPKTGYAAFWVGIDGYNSDTVEQTGTDSDCSSGTPAYYAWYEFYPEPSYEIIHFSVEPGDSISASVTYSGSEFTVSVKNERTGKTYAKTERVSGAKRSSAEWIAEAPSSNQGVLPLSDFGTVFLGQNSTGVSGTNEATIDSRSDPIGGFPSSSVESITMMGDDQNMEATPSALSSDKSSFSVQWF